MAVNSYSYATVAQVETLIGDLAEGRRFNETSTPTRAQIEQLIDDAASELHAAMLNAGYSVETNADLLASYPRAQAWLRRLNAVRAALMALDTMSAEAIYGAEGEDIAQTRSQRLYREWREKIRMIAGDDLAHMGMSRAQSGLTGLRVGSYQDSQGRRKLPLFRRGMSAFPGTQKLTDPGSLDFEEV